MGRGQQACKEDVLNSRTLRRYVPEELESSKYAFSRGGAPLKTAKMQVPRVRPTVPRWATRVGGGLHTLQQTAATGRRRERRVAPASL